MLGNNQHSAPWTDCELKWIREQYPSATMDEALQLLPGRTKTAIKHMASRLRVKKTPEAISKMNSLTNSGRVRTPENRAKISASLCGQKQSEETKQKRRDTHKQIAKFGPDNSNWKGDEVTADQSRWRARHMVPPGPCAKCDNPGVDVHHKDNNPFNNSPTNLIRLCKKHHMRAHAKMGREKRMKEREVQ